MRQGACRFVGFGGVAHAIAGTAWHGMLHCSMESHGMLHSGMGWHGMAWHTAAHHGMAWHDASCSWRGECKLPCLPSHLPATVSPSGKLLSHCCRCLVQHAAPTPPAAAEPGMLPLLLQARSAACTRPSCLSYVAPFNYATCRIDDCGAG